ADEVAVLERRGPAHPRVATEDPGAAYEVDDTITAVVRLDGSMGATDVPQRKHEVILSRPADPAPLRSHRNSDRFTRWKQSDEGRLFARCLALCADDVGSRGLLGRIRCRRPDEFGPTIRAGSRAGGHAFTTARALRSWSAHWLSVAGSSRSAYWPKGQYVA